MNDRGGRVIRLFNPLMERGNGSIFEILIEYLLPPGLAHHKDTAMPTVDENRHNWEVYDWPRGGDEWSGAWGSQSAQWYGTILPRLCPWLPTGTLLEIGPGFGRWTHFLKDLASRLILVDLTERCISECRARFALASNITYHVNDGRTLPMVPDGMVDLAFSFDSLVHVEADVIGVYLAELARKLSPDGVGFFHHSNLGTYATRLQRGRRLKHLGPTLDRLNASLARIGFTAPKHPRRAESVTAAGSAPLVGRGHRLKYLARIVDGLNASLARVGLTALNSHWRAESVTAAGFAALCRREGLQCRSQEIFPWSRRSNLLTDCFSVFTRPGSRWARENRIFVNQNFMLEATHAATKHQLYEI